MKIRTGFISNSSTTSFLIFIDKNHSKPECDTIDIPKKINLLFKHMYRYELNEKPSSYLTDSVGHWEEDSESNKEYLSKYDIHNVLDDIEKNIEQYNIFQIVISNSNMQDKDIIENFLNNNKLKYIFNPE